MRSKVLILTDEHFPKGWGIGRYSETLRQLLKESEFDVSVWGPGSPDAPFIITKSNPGYKNLQGIPKFCSFLSAIVNAKRRGQKIISIHPNTTYLLYLATRYFKFPQILIVWHGSDIYKLHKSVSEKWLENQRNIVISEYTYRFFNEHFPVIKPKVIYNTSLVKAQSLNIDLRQNIMLMVSRLDLRKGHLEVLRTLQNIDWFRMPDDFKLVIVGSGPDSSIISETVDALALNDRVKLMGHVDDKELMSLYSNSKYFLFASRDLNGRIEGFGLSLLEAVIFGCIPVVRNSGGQVEIVGDEYPFIYNKDNDLRECLYSLCNSNNQDLHQYLQRRITRFSRDNIAKKWLQILG